MLRLLGDLMVAAIAAGPVSPDVSTTMLAFLDDFVK